MSKRQKIDVATVLYLYKIRVWVDGGVVLVYSVIEWQVEVRPPFQLPLDTIGAPKKSIH